MQKLELMETLHWSSLFVKLAPYLGTMLSGGVASISSERPSCPNADYASSTPSPPHVRLLSMSIGRHLWHHRLRTSNLLPDSLECHTRHIRIQLRDSDDPRIEPGVAPALLW